MEPENENAQDMLEDIRLKFRIVCANLRVKLEYEGQSTSLIKDSEEM
jgi:RecB family endonuclease NucS